MVRIHLPPAASRLRTALPRRRRATCRAQPTRLSELDLPLDWTEQHKLLESAGSALLSQKQTLLGCRRKPRQPLRSVFVHEQPSARPKVCCILEQSHLCRREAIARGLVRHRIDDADQRLALWNVVKNFRWLRQPFGTVCRHQVLDFAPGRAGELESHVRSLSRLRARVQPVHVMPEDGCSIVRIECLVSDVGDQGHLVRRENTMGGYSRLEGPSTDRASQQVETVLVSGDRLPLFLQALAAGAAVSNGMTASRLRPATSSAPGTCCRAIRARRFGSTRARRGIETSMRSPP